MPTTITPTTIAVISLTILARNSISPPPPDLSFPAVIPRSQTRETRRRQRRVERVGEPARVSLLVGAAEGLPLRRAVKVVHGGRGLGRAGRRQQCIRGA